MSIKRTDSQMTTCIAMLEDDKGERRQAASANCSIRPGRGLSINIDVAENMEITDDDRKAVADMFGDYVMAELKKAREQGIPI